MNMGKPCARGALAAALAIAAGVAANFAVPASAFAADAFPARPVRIVVGFGPGGLGDTVTRALGQRMAESMGQSVVVENLPGAGGITAAQAVARAAPDGYTLGLSSGQNALSPFLFKSLPYDPVESFSMISTIGAFSFVLVTDKDSPLNTVSDVIMAGRKAPERFNIGTISAGSVQNLSAQLFVSMSRLTVPVVPFKTTGELIGALRGKQIEVALETSTGVIGQIKGGGLKAIATTAPARLSFLPEVPTVAESGGALAGYASESWNGIVAPAGVPREIVVKLNQEIARALAAPALQANFRNLGIEPKGGSPESLKARYRADQAKWGPVIERANIPRQ